MKHCLVRVFNASEKIKGSGFLITKKHIITCAHVVNFVFGRDSYDTRTPLTEHFFIDFCGVKDSQLKVKVIERHWHLKTQQNQMPDIDIAILELIDPLPSSLIDNHQIEIGLFADNLSYKGRDFLAHGFPEDTQSQERITYGTIKENLLHNNWLQVEAKRELVGHHIQPGFSGAPALLENTENIIGIIASYDNIGGKREGFIIPISCLYQALGLPENWRDTEKTILAIEWFELVELLFDIKIDEYIFDSFSIDFNIIGESHKSLKDFLSLLARKEHSLDSAPIFEFLEYIAVDKQLIADWQNKVSERLQLNLKYIAERVISAKNKHHKEQPIIIVEIYPEDGGISTDRYGINSWLYQQGTFINKKNKPNISKSDLDASFIETFKDFSALLSNDISPVIEVILPLSLLNWNINNIEIKRGRTTTKPIGEYYLFHIRSWDRIRDPEKLYIEGKKLWITKWKNIIDSGIKSEHIRCLTEKLICCDTLLSELENDALALIPSFDLSSFDDDVLNIFDIAIAAGLPCIYWIPQEKIDAAIKDEINNFFCSCKKTIWQEQIEINKKNPALPLWKKLMVLCDNPGLLPPDVNYQPDLSPLE